MPTLKYYDGSTWKSLTGPPGKDAPPIQQSGFSRVSSGTDNLVINTGVVTDLPLSTILSSSGAVWARSGNTFICPEDGIYVISGSISANGSVLFPSNFSYVVIRVDGLQMMRQFTDGGITSWETVSVSGQFFLRAGQTVSLAFAHFNGPATYTLRLGTAPSSSDPPFPILNVWKCGGPEGIRSDPGNMLSNPSFELDMQTWQLGWSTTVASAGIDSTIARTGLKSVKAVITNAGGGLQRVGPTAPFNVLPGDTVEISGWWRSSGASTAYAEIVLVTAPDSANCDFFGTGAATPTIVNPVYPSTANTWQRFVGQAVIPAGHFYCRPYFDIGSYAPATGWIDDCSIRRIETPAAPSLTVAFAQKVQAVLSGGGGIQWDGTNLKWSFRFLAIGMGRNPSMDTTGHYAIDMPPAGTVIKGYGGAADVTVTASGIPLQAFTALWYQIPWGKDQTSLPGNYRIVQYSTNFDVPWDWVLVAIYNNDGSASASLKLGTGHEIDHWKALTLINGWVDYDPGNFTKAAYRKQNGIVYLTGLIKSGVTTTSTIITTLPIGYRLMGSSGLSQNTHTPVVSNGAIAALNIYPTGEVKTNFGVSSSWLSLDGISYPAGN